VAWPTSIHDAPPLLPGLPPGKAPGHPPQQIRQQRGGGIIRYRDSSDCRILIVFHKPIMIAAAAPLRVIYLTCANDTVTNYCCRIRARTWLSIACRTAGPSPL
jgi:hypothetical protein